jgi:hypothetical protein
MATIMSKFIRVLTCVKGILKTYPALSAAVVNVGVALLSYFGLHVTGDELIYIVGLVTALLGLVVHSNVTPLARIEKVVEVTGEYLREREHQHPTGPQPALPPGATSLERVATPESVCDEETPLKTTQVIPK